jgi:hypothetical protein
MIGSGRNWNTKGLLMSDQIVTVRLSRTPGLTPAKLFLWICAALLVLLPLPAAAQPASSPVIVLIGPPGSGKSTQAARIGKQYKFAVINREQLMRADPSLLARAKSGVDRNFYRNVCSDRKRLLYH